ncbi:Hypothetical Protein XCAW_02663 [Xanthomonas citri subsp. citri Aw12879]|nr:Hypothetical Protein XCAW_02663 [Xanthomonas citri subsp. citri Aw12879]
MGPSAPRTPCGVGDTATNAVCVAPENCFPVHTSADFDEFRSLLSPKCSKACAVIAHR